MAKRTVLGLQLESGSCLRQKNKLVSMISTTDRSAERSTEYRVTISGRRPSSTVANLIDGLRKWHVVPMTSIEPRTKQSC